MSFKDYVSAKPQNVKTSSERIVPSQTSGAMCMKGWRDLWWSAGMGEGSEPLPRKKLDVNMKVVLGPKHPGKEGMVMHERRCGQHT